MPATLRAELQRIEAVPIVSTGTYLLSTGEATFTEEDLKAAVAALTDPAIHAPRIKIDGLGDSFDPEAHGGEPAFGYVDAMRVSDDGQTLVGDFMVPDWLASVIDWAYPSRSIEGGVGWESPTGKTHELVITNVALLGVDQPGVSVLEDLKDLLTNGTDVAPKEVIARMPARPGKIAAGLDQDLVRRRFYDWIESGDAELPDGTVAWDLWCRSLRFDDQGKPYLKVEDDADGRLYRVDFKVSGNDVAFGKFAEIAEQDVPVTAGAGRPLPPVAVWATRALSRDKQTAATPGVPHNEEENIMDPKVREVLERQGLDPDKASEEQITAAQVLVAAESLPGQPAAETPPAEPKPEGDDKPDEEPEEQPATDGELEPIAAQRDAEFKRISTEVTDLRAKEAEREKTETKTRRDQKIEASKSKIFPHERDHYRGLLDIDEVKASALIDDLPDGRVPLDERGVAAVAEDTGQGAALSESTLLNPKQRAALVARGL